MARPVGVPAALVEQPQQRTAGEETQMRAVEQAFEPVGEVAGEQLADQAAVAGIRTDRSSQPSSASSSWQASRMAAGRTRCSSTSAQTITP